MGFGFRKSFGNRYLRVTLSRSGISSSVGVPGARVTFSPRGSYVTLGAKGFSYRKRLSGRRSNSAAHIQSPSNSNFSDSFTQEFSLPSTFLADTDVILQSNPSDTINSLNETLRARSLAALPIGLCGFLAFIFLCINPIASLIMLTAGILMTVIVHMVEEKSLRYDLIYEDVILSSPQWTGAERVLEKAGCVSRIWIVTNQGATYDYKNNAGASQLVSRVHARIAVDLPKRVYSNAAPFSIVFGNSILCLLPDQLYYYDGRQVAGISYQSLHVSESEINFIEDELRPVDSMQVGETWRYVNKDGQPDRRYANNYRLPILRYGEVVIKAPGLFVNIKTSNPQAAKEIVSALSLLKRP